MSRWTMLITAGMLILASACGAGQPAPSAPPPAPSSTLAVTATVAPTAAPVATAAPSATTEPVATPVAPPAAATAEVSTTIGGQTVGGDFTPKVRSVWNTAVGLDQMTGPCSKGSMLPVYGLVQITPDGDKLQWKNQEPAPYTMNRLQLGVYQYAGPSAIKDGVVTMTVKFLSDKALEMSRQFVSTADPDCLHTHVYTGTFQWVKP